MIKIKENAVEFLPAWKGLTAVCIAGGASLTQEQVDAVKGCKIIAINDAYKLAPNANILYACDSKWWDWHNGVETFKGLRLQHLCENKADNAFMPYPDIDCVISTGKQGFEERPDGIRHGGNSGYQALHVAMHLGAANILLLGYDMHQNTGKSHWFGDHPSGKQRESIYSEWLECFPALEVAAKERGQRIINCTPGSALECFEKINIKDVLNML